MKHATAHVARIRLRNLLLLIQQMVFRMWNVNTTIQCMVNDYVWHARELKILIHKLVGLA